MAGNDDGVAAVVGDLRVGEIVGVGQCAGNFCAVKPPLAGERSGAGGRNGGHGVAADRNDLILGLASDEGRDGRITAADGN